MNDNIVEKSDWEKEMDELISNVERDIDSFVVQYDKEPECIICSVKTIEDILNHLIEPDMLKTINWKNPQGVGVEIRAVELRIFRTMDLPYGQFFLR